MDGIERYLGSGMIRGIGPAYVKRLVQAFDATVFEVIESEPAFFFVGGRHRYRIRIALFYPLQPKSPTRKELSGFSRL